MLPDAFVTYVPDRTFRESMPTDHTWATNSLNNLGNSFALTLASIDLLRGDAIQSLVGRVLILSRDSIVGGASPTDRSGERFELDLGEIQRLKDTEPDKYPLKLEEFWKFARRNLIKEAFEVSKAYAKYSGQLPAFKSAPLYHFARLIRNCFSHDHHFQFNQFDRSILPVTWDGVTLDAGLDGKQMLGWHLNPLTAWRLFEELRAWVRAH